MVHCEGVLGFLIGPLEIGARIMIKVIGTFKKRSIKVVFGSAEKERGSLVVLATRWQILVDLSDAIEQHGAIFLQQTCFCKEGTLVLLVLAYRGIGARSGLRVVGVLATRWQILVDLSDTIEQHGAIFLQQTCFCKEGTLVLLVLAYRGIGARSGLRVVGVLATRWQILVDLSDTIEQHGAIFLQQTCFCKEGTLVLLVLAYRVIGARSGLRVVGVLATRWQILVDLCDTIEQHGAIFLQQTCFCKEGTLVLLVLAYRGIGARSGLRVVGVLATRWQILVDLSDTIEQHGAIFLQQTCFCKEGTLVLLVLAYRVIGARSGLRVVGVLATRWQILVDLCDTIEQHGAIFLKQTCSCKEGTLVLLVLAYRVIGARSGFRVVGVWRIRATRERA